MLSFVLKRLGLLIPTFFGITLITFGLIRMIPGDPVLIMVGIMMASDIGDIDWRNLEVAVPAYFTMMIMCFGYNIADGIAIGFIMFSFVKLAVGKWSEVSWLVRGLSAMFLLRFVFMLFY